MSGTGHGWQFVVGHKPNARMFMVRIADFGEAEAATLRMAGVGGVVSYAMVADDLLAGLGLQVGDVIEFKPADETELIESDGYHRRRSTDA